MLKLVSLIYLQKYALQAILLENNAPEIYFLLEIKTCFASGEDHLILFNTF